MADQKDQSFCISEYDLELYLILEEDSYDHPRTPRT